MRSSALRTAAIAVSGTLTAMALLTGCTNTPAPADPAAEVVSSLGAVPIPSAPPGIPAPVNASVGHPQLLAMGAPVRVSLPGDVDAVVTTSGPAGDPPPGGVTPNRTVTGVITVTVTPTRGSVRLAASDLASKDQTGASVTLTPQGSATATATPGHPATVRVTGTFQQGGAQINWRQDGHVLAIWDFTVEND